MHASSGIHGRTKQRFQNEPSIDRYNGSRVSHPSTGDHGDYMTGGRQPFARTRQQSKLLELPQEQALAMLRHYGRITQHSVKGCGLGSSIWIGE